MSINHILFILTLGIFAVGCTNDLKFSKGSNGGLDNNPPGACPNSVGDFVAPPDLVEIGQVLSLVYGQDEVSWSVQQPDGTSQNLNGNDVSYTVSQLGRHNGRLESINSCGTIQVLHFTFDAFLPVGASSLIINGGETYTSKAEVSLSLLSDGATEMYITEDATCSSGGQWEIYNASRLHTLQDRNNSVSVYAKFKNPVGNTSSCVSDSIIHDDIKPVVQIASAPSQITNLIGADFTLAASDSGSGVDMYFCSLDSGKVNVCANQVKYSNLSDGSHVFNTRVSDKAGNLSDWVQHTWLVDTVKPTLQFTRTPSNPSTTASAYFSFEGNDTGSGLDGFECKLDAGNYGPCVSPQTITVTDGSHTYYVRAKDKAGNISDEIFYTWMTDATAPVIQITSAPANQTTEKEANIHFTVTDAGLGVDTVKCSLDNAALVDCVSPVLHSGLDLGAHSFKIVATDKAGHTSQAVHNWTVQRRVIEQPEVVPPGVGAADILFVMDNTSSMYSEYRDHVPYQMRNFLSRISSNYQIGVITGDDRNNSSPYSAGRLVAVEEIYPYEYLMTPQTENVDRNFISTLARREVTCVHGTWTGPNGRFCGKSGWNLPSSTQLISSTLMALDLPENQVLFREETPLHIVMVSDGNEVCSSGMYGSDGMCLPGDYEHRAESVVEKVQNLWPAKTLKVHSLIWREGDNCAFRGGSKKGTTYEYLSQITGGTSRSICNPSAIEGNAIADAIKSSDVHTIALQCTPIDVNNDGVVDASDVTVTYKPQPAQLPNVTLVDDKLKFEPAPAAGTEINLRYTCP